jgi:hypothetical protein
MFTFHAEIKRGSKGCAADHCRYDARLGKWSDLDDLLAFDFGNMPSWSQDHPLRFWRYADRWERKGGAAYREWIIALPNQLSIDTNVSLVREIVEALVGPRPWQFAIHGPEAELGGCVNLHCHLMYSDRPDDGIARPADRYFTRYNPNYPERGGCRKLSGGKSPAEMSRDLVLARQTIATIINRYMEEAGLSGRVDHRSFRTRGIDQVPEVHLGKARISLMSSEKRSAYVAKRATRARFSAFG